MSDKVQTVQFYTIGEDYQALMESFFKEGSFKLFETLCKDGNFEYEQLRKCFELKLQLKGDSRDEEGIVASFLEHSPEDFKETLICAINTATSKYRDDYDDPILELERIAKKDENISVLLSYYSIEEIIELLKEQIIQDRGFKITTLLEAVQEKVRTTGLLLQNGIYVECGDQDHIILYPVLLRLNMIGSGGRDGHHDSDAVVISTNQICGRLGWTLERGTFKHMDGTPISDIQLEELWKVRDYPVSFYGNGYNLSLGEAIRRVWIERLDKGGKQGNLEFLKAFYPHIKLCDFYSSYLFTEPRKIIVRTSPEKSLPGLLNSIVCNTREDIISAIKKIKEDFELVKDIRKGNKIHWFYQDFLEGQNGVVNCFEKHRDDQPGKTLSAEYRLKNRYDIYIACSDKQGAIVQGEVGNVELGFDESRILRNIARELANDFKTDIQLEFVKVGEGDIRIVQFRTFQNNPTVIFHPSEDELKKALVVGKTFSTGGAQHTWYNYRDIKVENILVVEQDGESSLLVGKKALIVTNDTTFSHLLALSKALNIPSIYATGPVDFKGQDTVDFSTQYIIGYVKQSK